MKKNSQFVNNGAQKVERPPYPYWHMVKTIGLNYLGHGGTSTLFVFPERNMCKHITYHDLYDHVCKKSTRSKSKSYVITAMRPPPPLSVLPSGFEDEITTYSHAFVIEMAQRYNLKIELVEQVEKIDDTSVRLFTTRPKNMVKKKKMAEHVDCLNEIYAMSPISHDHN